MEDLNDKENELLKNLYYDASDLFKSLTEYEDFVVTNNIHNNDSNDSEKSKQNYKLLFNCLNYISNIHINSKQLLNNIR